MVFDAAPKKADKNLRNSGQRLSIIAKMFPYFQQQLSLFICIKMHAFGLSKLCALTFCKSTYIYAG